MENSHHRGIENSPSWTVDIGRESSVKGRYIFCVTNLSRGVFAIVTSLSAVLAEYIVRTSGRFYILFCSVYLLCKPERDIDICLQCQPVDIYFTTFSECHFHCMQTVFEVPICNSSVHFYVNISRSIFLQHLVGSEFANVRSLSAVNYCPVDSSKN